MNTGAGCAVGAVVYTHFLGRVSLTRVRARIKQKTGAQLYTF